MVNEILPIGSVIKTNKGKLCVVIGYYGYDPSKMIKFITDYIVTPFPFDYNNLDYGEEILKKHDWYDFCINHLNNNEIVEVLFEGYKNEQFYQFKNDILKDK